jgi:hypothetical protein
MSVLNAGVIPARIVQAGAPHIRRICPSPPPGAEAPTDRITGYVLWGVIAIMGVALLTGIGAVAMGRLMSMPHSSRIGVISLLVVFVCGAGLGVVTGMFNGLIGEGCVNINSSPAQPPDAPGR